MLQKCVCGCKMCVLLDVVNKHILIGCKKACILMTAEWHGCRKAYSYSPHTPNLVWLHSLSTQISIFTFSASRLPLFANVFAASVASPLNSISAELSSPTLSFNLASTSIFSPLKKKKKTWFLYYLCPRYFSRFALLRDHLSQRQAKLEVLKIQNPDFSSGLT